MPATGASSTGRIGRPRLTRTPGHPQVPAPPKTVNEEKKTIAEVTDTLAKTLGAAPAKMPAAPETPAEWRDDARRVGPLPDGLFEVVRFKDAELAH